jgi:biotin carboxyl carrier protein
MKTTMEEQNLTNKFIIDDAVFGTRLTKKFQNRKPYIPPDKSKLIAYIPGSIKQIFVNVGDAVKTGDKLLILEAMKMKNIIKSPKDGKIKSIHVKVDEKVAKDAILVEFE